MNRTVRHVAVAMIAMFVALLINSNVVQVGEASSLNSNPANHRPLYDSYSRQRGPIVAGGTDVARSVATKGALKYLRVYPQGKVYAPATGYFSLVYGSTGVEQGENGVLAGTSNKLFFNRLSDEITGHQPRGGSVVLTLDPRAQQAAYNALAQHTVDYNGVRSGAVVALDPRTGAILALASYPSYDPSVLSTHNSKQIRRSWHQLVTDPSNPMLDRALNETYPPGSTFKVITAATALSSGKYNPQSQLPAPNQLSFPETTHTLSNFEGETCPGGGSISLSDALKVSCNTAFGALGLRLGGDRLAAQTQKFGFGQSLSVPLPVSPSRYDKPPSQALLADSAIGQYDDAVTPLQMAMVAAAVANHGLIMKPYLVKQTRKPDASVLSTTHPTPFSQAISPAVASELTTMMERVVNESGGTGGAARIAGITVAGKTGTAENQPGAPTHAWFIAFAPAEHPKIAVAVVVPHGGQGGVAAAPIARTVMCSVLGCS
ncbi:MAG TPA: penicillin-binding protein 2 [Mycobacteriales bacterium]|nr:penicillin-binding protein 2 [Mycobacteriales bacterium]